MFGTKMESEQDNKPRLTRGRRGNVVGSFYSEPELPDWRLCKRDWEAIEDTLDIPTQARRLICEISRRYFVDRDAEILALNAAITAKYAGQVKRAAAHFVSVLSSDTDSPEVTVARDALVSVLSFNTDSPEILAARDVLSECLTLDVDLEAYRNESGAIDFDAIDSAMESTNPLDEVLREIAGAIHGLDRAANRIREAADLLSAPDSLRPKKPTATAWAKMLRDIDRVFRASKLPTGAKNDNRKGASQFTLFMLELTQHWPERFRQFNVGRDGEKSPTAMASAINDTRRIARGDPSDEGKS